MHSCNALVVIVVVIGVRVSPFLAIEQQLCSNSLGPIMQQRSLPTTGLENWGSRRRGAATTKKPLSTFNLIFYFNAIMASNSDGGGSNGEFLCCHNDDDDSSCCTAADVGKCFCCCSCSGTLTRNYSIGSSGSPRDYETLKQQYEIASSEINNLRRLCEHARSVSALSWIPIFCSHMFVCVSNKTLCLLIHQLIFVANQEVHTVFCWFIRVYSATISRFYWFFP